MDFDEYDYLEKTVENPDIPPENALPPAAGNGSRSEEKDRRSSRHRDDEEADPDSNHRLKRSRSKDDSSRDPDRHSSRSRSRHRSTPDGRSRESERDRNHRSGREHENGKDRGRDREREERERIREREKEKERELDRSRRSRSRSERHRSEERDRNREKSKEMEFRERDLRERDHDARRYKEKKEEVAEPEADPERDQRTVFAYQISLKADERDVYEFFSRAGKVRDVRLIMDRNSRRSKGVGYIEFYDSLSVPMAIALSGQLLLGQPVMVKPSEAEKNLVQSTATTGGVAGNIGPYSGGARRLYVGNLHFHITEEQLRLLFEPFGHVELVQLPRDPETGHCKGYGFVQFARLEESRAALALNGMDIGGRSIKVSAVVDQVGMPDGSTNTGDFDDDEGGGLSLNARSRALLMQKLDRSGTATSVAGALVPPVVNAPALSVPGASVLGVPPTILPLLPSPVPALLGLPTPGFPPVTTPSQPADTAAVIAGVPSECLLLKNMFDPNKETEPDFDLDIKEDVQDECSKFGTIKHIFVDKNSAGHVYLCFDNTTSAMKAQSALNGRWFAGKMVTATFMPPQSYEAKFPGSS